MPRPVIICVDDEKTVLSGLKQELEFGLGRAYEFEIAESAEEGLELIRELLGEGLHVPLVISDQLMPGMKGDEMLVALHQIAPNTRKILLTGQASADAVGNAVNHANLYRYIAKPWEQQDLKLTVEGAVSSYFAELQMGERATMLKRLNHNLQALGTHRSVALLAQHLIGYLVNDTGATRGLLLTHNEDAHPQNAKSDLIKTADILASLQGYHATDAQLVNPAWSDDWRKDFSVHVVQQTLQAKTLIQAGNAFREAAWQHDAVLTSRGIRSFICAPVLNAKNELLAIVYLEKPTEPDYFTPLHTEYITLMLNQAAIAFTTTAQYEALERKVTQRSEVIAEKTQELNDSLRYASRIQTAILPNLSPLQRHFTDTFSLYLPKEIVSGDFYWLYERPVQEADGSAATDGAATYLYLAVGDSTGVGVPAAFLSVLGITLLNQLVKEQRMTEPAEILFHVNRRMRENLKGKLAGSNFTLADHEGIALSLLRFTHAAGKPPVLHFSGANMPAYLLHKKVKDALQGNGTIEYLEPASITLGWGGYKASSATEQNPFKVHEVELAAGDMIYVYTDGYPSQFGSKGNIVFSQERFLKKLQEIYGQPASAQYSHLDTLFQEWRGDQPQTDDILVLGLRVG